MEKQTQPEALRLADELDVGDFDVLTNYAAATELRHLHEANQAMLEALKWIDQYYRIERNKNHMVAEQARSAIAKGEQQ